MKQYVELSFMGIDPDEVTATLGIEPTVTRRAGESEGAGPRWKRHYWSLRSGIDESELDTTMHFAALFDKIEPSGAAINKLSSLNNPVISWVVNVRAHGATPTGGIPRDIVERIYKIGADLDVDIYVDADEPDIMDA